MHAPNSKWLAAILLILPALFIAGCGDDNPTGAASDDPPALPDQYSFYVDNSAFPASPQGGKPSGNPRDVTWEDYGGGNLDKGSPDVSGAPVADSAGYSNYVTGRAVVSVVQAAVVAFSAAPASAFAGAFLATPAKQEDGSWTWSYSVIYGSVQYDLALNGNPSADYTDWSMRVSTAGLTQNLSNFLWYSGQTQNAGRSGYWQVYDGSVPSSQTNLIRVDWNRTVIGDRSSTWLNNRVGSASYGDVLSYDETGADAALEFTKASNGQQSYVRWNIASTAGSVRIPVYNGGQEACWDESHFNANCSQ